VVAMTDESVQQVALHSLVLRVWTAAGVVPDLNLSVTQMKAK
jgi:hypothetical protein